MLGDPIGSLCRKYVIKTLLFRACGSIFISRQLTGRLPWRFKPRLDALCSTHSSCFGFNALVLVVMATPGPESRGVEEQNLFPKVLADKCVFAAFCCGGSRPLTPSLSLLLLLVILIRRLLEFPVLTRVPRMNHPEVPRRLQQPESALIPVPPPPPPPPLSSTAFTPISLSPLSLYLPLSLLSVQQMEASGHVTGRFPPALCRPLLPQNRLVPSENQTDPWSSVCRRRVDADQQEVCVLTRSTAGGAETSHLPGLKSKRAHQIRTVTLRGPREASQHG